MMRSLTSAISGLQGFQGKMDIIGNNIANVSTVAYKSARTDFGDSFSQTLREATDGSAGVQIGTGLSTSAVVSNFNQGAISATGVPTDLAIEDGGFFCVADPSNSALFYTRAGDFRVDKDGYLVTATGERLQGYNTSGLSAGSTGDLRIDTTGAPATAAPDAQVASFAIDTAGVITVTLSDSTKFTRGQVLLQRFNDNQGLIKVGGNLYSAGTGAGAAGSLTEPGTGGVGTIRQGYLELSNVDLANEFADMITAQRAFQATARVITTSDEMLQELVNLKR